MRRWLARARTRLGVWRPRSPSWLAAGVSRLAACAAGAAAEWRRRRPPTSRRSRRSCTSRIGACSRTPPRARPAITSLTALLGRRRRPRPPPRGPGHRPRRPAGRRRRRSPACSPRTPNPKCERWPRSPWASSATPRPRPALVTALGDTDPRVQGRAAEALGLSATRPRAGAIARHGRGARARRRARRASTPTTSSAIRWRRRSRPCGSASIALVRLARRRRRCARRCSAPTAPRPATGGRSRTRCSASATPTAAPTLRGWLTRGGALTRAFAVKGLGGSRTPARAPRSRRLADGRAPAARRAGAGDPRPRRHRRRAARRRSCPRCCPRRPPACCGSRRWRRSAHSAAPAAGRAARRLSRGRLGADARGRAGGARQERRRDVHDRCSRASTAIPNGACAQRWPTPSARSRPIGRRSAPDAAGADADPKVRGRGAARHGAAEAARRRQSACSRRWRDAGPGGAHGRGRSRAWRAQAARRCRRAGDARSTHRGRHHLRRPRGDARGAGRGRPARPPAPLLTARRSRMPTGRCACVRRRCWRS